MSGSQEAGRSNPLAGKVTIHRLPDFVGVRFLFGNQTERPIGVSFSQPIPDGTAPEQFRFQPERHGDSWTLSDAELSFAVEIDGGSTAETGYALTDTAVSTVWNAINQGTVTVSDADGDVLGEVGGLEPNVVDESKDDADDAAAETASVADESAETATEPTTGESTADPTATEESERDDNSPPGQSGSSPAPGEESGMDASSEGEDDPDSVAAVDATAVAELAEELDAETPATEGDGGGGGDGESARAATTGGGPETGEDSDGEAADLPATRADYILSDVRGEIQSAAEFEWRTLRERSKARQVVDRVRSWLGF
jgi:hypothetical protein